MSKPKQYDEDDITRYIDIVVAQMKEEFKIGFEAIGFIKEQLSDLPRIKADVAEIKDDNKAINAAITATNKGVTYLMSVAHSH